MRHAPAIHTFANSGSSRLRHLVGTLGTLASLGIAGLSLSAAPVLAEDCPNAALRAENNSTRLPECRAYEMVTPLYKQGFGVEPQTYSDDGGDFAFLSVGNLAGGGTGFLFNQYVATRSSTGWATTALDPPVATYLALHSSIGAPARSADLRSSLWVAKRREAPADSAWFYYLRGPDDTFTRVGQTQLPGLPDPNTLGVSADLSHVVFMHGPGGNPANTALYEFVGTGNNGPPRLVNVDNNGQQLSSSGGSCLNGMSADGRVIVFSCGGGVSARVGGSATVRVSGSECTRTSGDPGGACNAAADANFAGMATDGSRVYFTTTQQLVNGDTDQTNDLYECDVPPGAPAPVGLANPCASLSEVSDAATGANVADVINVSKDGSRVYFFAQGVLAGNLGTNDARAVAGDHNLYVWEKDAAHPAGQTTFVAKLESGMGRAESTADGRYLVFFTASRLLASDTDEANDVYRYDAATGTLLRLSTDTNGSGGNEPGAEATTLGFGFDRPMTDDGTTIAFGTTERLSPADTNSGPDVYEWHNGQVSSISRGEGLLIGISGSGRDIFFDTAQPLTTADRGTEGDVYDARIGGGFDLTTPAPCSGEACQGAPAPLPQPLGASASAAFSLDPPFYPSVAVE